MTRTQGGSPEGNIDKLPKWAQRRIRRLEADVRSYQERERQMTEFDTEVAVLDYENGDIPLPARSTIVFRMEPGDDVDDHRGTIMVTRQKDPRYGYYLEVQAYDGMPVVVAQSTNTLRIPLRPNHRGW